MTDRLHQVADRSGQLVQAIHDRRAQRRVRILTVNVDRLDLSGAEAGERAVGPAEDGFDAAGDDAAITADDAVFEFAPRGRADFGKAGGTVLTDAELFSAGADGVANGVGLVPHGVSVAYRHVGVNPLHLEPVTPGENTRRMHAAKRSPVGSTAYSNGEACTTRSNAEHCIGAHDRLTK